MAAFTPTPLTDAERERLGLLAEECAEVVKECMKVLRFGWAPTNHDTGEAYDNRAALQRELTDVSAIYNMMMRAGDIAPIRPDEMEAKIARVLRFTRYQTPSRN